MDKYSEQTIINEIVGLLTGTQPSGLSITPQTTNNQSSGSSISGIPIGFSHRLQGWQSQVVNTLASGKDIYVIATPSAGKTLPVVTTWARMYLGINPELLANPGANNASVIYNNLMKIFLKPENIQKVLFLVPVRTLAYGTTNDFIEIFSNLFTKAVQLNLYYTKQNINSNMPIFNVLFNFKGGRELKKYIINSQKLNYYLNSHSINKNDYEQQSTTLHNLIMKQLEITIPDYVQNVLIYSQTGVGTIGRSNPKIAPVIITIYESGPSIFEKIQNNLGLLVVDEAHLTQSLVDDIQDRAPQIVDKLYWVIKNLSRSTRLAFLSGTINPASAKDLSNYLDVCFNRKLVVQNNAPIGNPATIKVIPDNNVNNEDYLINEVINPKTSNTLIVLFSKTRIDRIVDKALLKSTSRPTVQQVDKGIYQKHKFSSFDEEQLQKNLNFKIVPGAENIKNPRLLEAISAGFGWIYRPAEGIDVPEQLTKSMQQDFIIVAELFRQGKIKVLLATDAVGIGVNINVQRMILPTIEKFDGHQMKQMPISQLAQLLNRTGRRAFNVGVVYTSEEWTGEVVRALSIGPEQFEVRATVENIPRSLCKLNNFARSLWYNMTRR